MAAVEVRGLRKSYDGAKSFVLQGIDLASEDGEYIVLLGPSGCGKTTLLRTIAGLEHATEGDVLIGGNVVNGLPPRARSIAKIGRAHV